MSDPRQTQLWATLHAILCNLSLKNGAEHLTGTFADTIQMISENKSPPDKNYIITSRSGTKKDAQKIIDRLTKLKASMHAIHKQTYELFYDNGIRPYDVIQFCAETIDSINNLNFDGIPKNIGRGKSKGRADFVTELLAGYFESLTGKPATIVTKDGVAGGPFISLVRDIFAACSIKASPEGCAKRAVRKRNARKATVKTPFEAASGVT